VVEAKECRGQPYIKMKMLHRLVGCSKVECSFSLASSESQFFVCVWAIGKSDVVVLAWPFGYLSAQQIQASAQQKALEASACWKDFFFTSD